MLFYLLGRAFELIVILNLLSSSVSAYMQSDIEYDGQMSVALQHALNSDPDPVFSDRGTVTVQSIRSGSVTMSQNLLTSEEKTMLKELIERDGLYRLQAIVTTSGANKFTFLTFTKARVLYESKFSDILTISLDHNGNPVAVSLAPSGSFCEDSCHLKANKFNTTVFVRHMEQGPIPDTTAYIQKLEREKEALNRGEVKDNRSFFAKYWMYIVPVVIFVLISSATNPEGGAAAGGR